MNLDATINNNIEQSIKKSPMTSTNNEDDNLLLSSSNLSIEIQHQPQQRLITRELIKQENVVFINVRILLSPTFPVLSQLFYI